MKSIDEFDKLVESAEVDRQIGDFIGIENVVKLFKDGEFAHLELDRKRQSALHMTLAYNIMEENKELLKKLADS